MSLLDSGRSKTQLPSPEESLPGREQPLPVAGYHAVLDTPLQPPFPDGIATTMFGLGCFWGAERRFWEQSGVFTTAVGYAGGHTPNPTYEEVCSGRTGHAEVVLVAYSPADLSYQRLLSLFWESHDPTQGMRQGNDAGTQYRSCIYTLEAAQAQVAQASRDTYDQQLQAAGHLPISTEIRTNVNFYYAEDYHQQYLHKNPGGYCGIGGTGVCYPSEQQVV